MVLALPQAPGLSAIIKITEILFLLLRNAEIKPSIHLTPKHSVGGLFDVPQNLVDAQTSVLHQFCLVGHQGSPLKRSIRLLTRS
jgi:hypothetical protein